MPRLSATALVVLAISVACTGAIDGPAPQDPSAPDVPNGGGGASPLADRPASGGAGGTTPSACVAPSAPAPVPMHRLTAAEVDATLFDLLGDDTRPARAWPAAASSTGFDNSSGDQSFSTPVIKAIADTAADVAARAVTRLGSILPCDPAKTGEQACATAFIERFGRLAFRRPLAAEDRTRLQAAYAAGQTAGGFTLGVQTVIEAALMSPHFLYRVEGTTDSSTLTQHELAARLSYFLTGSMPDGALTADADAGKLGDAVAQHARRLLATTRGKETIASFHRQWLHLDHAIGVTRDAKLFPKFSDRTSNALVDGALAFTSWVFSDPAAGSFAHLFTSPVAFVNADSAWVFDANASGAALAKLERPAAERAGVVTLPAVLGGLGGKPASSAPVMRGKLVREQLLCQSVPPPPPDADMNVPEPKPGQTTRQRFAEHSTAARCAVCHRLLDGVGFGFEAYDAVGAYRTSEGGLAIDVSGMLIEAQGVEGPFSGAVELAGKLARSSEARGCLSRMWLRFAFTRLDAPEDECLITDLTEKLSAADFRLSELPVVIATSAAFRTRAAAPPSPQCQP